jgi:hypothetical protein
VTSYKNRTAAAVLFSGKSGVTDSSSPCGKHQGPARLSCPFRLSPSRSFSTENIRLKTSGAKRRPGIFSRADPLPYCRYRWTHEQRSSTASILTVEEKTLFFARILLINYNCASAFDQKYRKDSDVSEIYHRQNCDTRDGRRCVMSVLRSIRLEQYP